MYLMIDSHDSFVWNLVRYVRRLGASIEVASSDRLDIEALLSRSFQGVLISPGPGRPEQYPQLLEFIRRAGTLARPLPILGVCLGHQALAVAHGARIDRGSAPMYGKISDIVHQGQGVFCGLPSPLAVTRYHALIVAKDSLPPQLAITALAPDAAIMGLCHRSLPQEGVQFHPEAELSQGGLHLIENFLRACQNDRPERSADEG